MSPQSSRRHFAAGDFLTRYTAGEPFSIRIDSASVKEGWNARTSPDFGKTVFPGTAIKFEERYYEIVMLNWESIGSAERSCYYLSPWEDRFPIRVQFPYTAQECYKAVRSLRKQKQASLFTVFILLIAPLAGMLPAADQTRIENAFGIQGTRLTFLSSLFLLFPGAFSLILLIVSLFGSMTGEAGPRPSLLYFIGSYLFVECFLRILCAWKLEEPMGSLFLYFPIELYRSIRRQTDPAYRQKLLLMDQVLNATDEIKETSGPDHDLEVLSLLPKPHWNSLTGISYRNVWYGLIESQLLREGKIIRHKFLLKMAPEGTFFRTTCSYSPEEVRDLFRAQRRRDLGTWVQTFAVFWGLLSTKDQKRLEKLYDFDSLKFSRITIVTLGTLAFFNLVAAVFNAANGLATVVDSVLVLPSGYLLLESYFRWVDIRTGEPSGSILQYLVRPFASRLLED